MCYSCGMHTIAAELLPPEFPTNTPEDIFPDVGYRPDAHPTLRERIASSRLGRAALGSLAALGLLSGCATEVETDLVAFGPDHVYTVTGTNGDGVWLHGDPGLGDTGDLIKIMPEGTKFTADCYVIDTPIGSSGNPAWLHGRDQQGDAGYFADFYSDSRWDGVNTLEKQGLPVCGSLAPAVAVPDQPGNPGQEGAAVFTGVFYAPGDGEVVEWNGKKVPLPVLKGLFTMADTANRYPLWNDDTGTCNTSSADDFESIPHSGKITRLGGYSLGRLGPTYYLQGKKDQGIKDTNIDYILLVDPGTKDELLNNVCDKKYDENTLYAEWLASDPKNRLTVLAGETTEDQDNQVDGRAHAGIQEGLFKVLKQNAGLASRVTVCNYPRTLHDSMIINLGKYLMEPRIESPNQCPPNPSGGSVIGWRP